MDNDNRLNPDDLLSQIQKNKTERGRLKIFFGMSAGVGKTYSMLKEARLSKQRGEDIVIGWIESHGRKETDEQAEGIEMVAPQVVEYRGVKFKELDLEALLKRKPSIAIVDELAHTNTPGLKHPKRYQDVLELMDSGIDVYTTVNIQHLESMADVVEELAQIRIHERIPDSVFDQASDVQLVDIPPEELIQRLEEGKVYTGDKSKEALLHFFKKEKLAMLRELSLRHAAELASHQLTNILRGEDYFLSKSNSQNILVAISPSPNSEYLIRWTRRFAYHSKSKWTCIYIETAGTLSEYQKDCLTKNITLARNLGARVVTFPRENIVEGITGFARENNISMIIIGKSGLTQIRKFFKGRSLSEQIIRESGKISVIAVQEKDSCLNPLKSVRQKIETSPPWQYGCAVFIVISITIINCFLVQFTGYWSASIFYLASISLLAMVLDRTPVLFMACLSAFLWNFMFIPPRFTFAIHKTEDILMFFLYFFVALTSGWMTSRLKSHQKMLEIREFRMTLLNELSISLESATEVINAVETGREYISRAFQCETIIFLKNEEGSGLSETPVTDSLFKKDEKDYSAARFCFNEGQATGRYTTTLPVAVFHYVPMAVKGGTIGVIGIKLDNKRSWTNDEESFLLMLSNTVSLAVDREILAERNRKNILVQESERISRILLQSISHELRTPLAIIQGSASAMLDGDTINDVCARDQLIEEILTGSDKLNSIVENLLSMTRLESGRLKLNIILTDPEDLISLAIRQVSRELGTRRVNIAKPDEFPLVPCDIVLIIQVISNILQNAARYTPIQTDIDVKIEILDDCMYFIVEDNGPGVRESELPYIFDKFFRGENAKKGGTGLGLSICRGIIEAHGGMISAKNRINGGLAMEFKLPLNRDKQVQK